MTDTTDIAVLYATAMRAKETGTSFVIPAETAISMLTHVGVLRDNLEAERQLADELKINWDAAKNSIQFYKAELAALKREQVPVEYQMYYHNHGTGGGEWCRVRTKSRYEELQREHAGDDDFSFRALFTATQKPVVLLNKITQADAPEVAEISAQVERLGLKGAYGAYAAGWNAAIEAAGGIVKDGE